MSFDASRFSFDAWKDRSGVVMQQGRPQLDSDWNEWMAILNRRIQAGTLDTMGRVAVPSTTPYGFKITATQSGTTNTLTIGVGRIYVDGLLVENHGTAATTTTPYDRALAELSHAPQTTPPAPEADIDFKNQPHLPNPVMPTTNGPFIVYLDAWQRDVTYLQAPDLIEKALGVDTTGRLQTVWQVKFLDVSQAQPTGMTCSTQVDLWDALIEPSPSRLTTDVVASVSPGPCSLASGAGYTGVENQLYRVEIHQPGGFNAAATGTGATFKWSRDNGSVASAVTAINPAGSASQLTVQSTGKDDVLSFHPGDWIEITDDAREFAGVTGDLMQIAPDGVDLTGQTILLTKAVAANIINNLNGTPASNLGNCHTRIQRWDTGTVYLVGGTPAAPTTTTWVTAGTRGDIPVPPKGQSVMLENGVTVAFDLAPTTDGLTPAFVPGDYWCFAARNDGSVERLRETPPRGAHHHYARLAVVTFGNPAANCPLPWPPVTTAGDDTCACTVCVDLADYLLDNAAIANAVTKVAAMNGGRVCLGAGAFVLGTTPLILSTLAHVTLCGQGAATGLIYSGTGAAVQVSQAWDVHLEDLAVIATYTPPKTGSGVIAGILVQNSLGVTVERCSVLTVDATPAALTPSGLPLDPFQILKTSTGSSTGTGIGILLDSFLIETKLRDNLLIGDIGIASTTAIAPTLTNPQTNTNKILVLDGIEISRNSLNCTMAGIAIGVNDTTEGSFFIGPTDISNNRIEVSQLMGIALTGYSLPNAIVRVDGNYVEAPLIGIASLVDGALIEDNLVTQPAVATMSNAYPFATGIGAAGPLEIATTYARATVLRNRVQNWAGTGVAAFHLALATVQDNAITNVLVTGISASINVELRVCGNEVFTVSSNPSSPAGTEVIGISIGGAVNAVIEGNTVGIIAPAGGVNAAGMHIINILSGSVNGNQVNQIGPITDLSFTPYGIFVENPMPASPTLPLLLALTMNNNTVLQFSPTAVTGMSNFKGLAVVAPASNSFVTLRDNTVTGGSLQPLILVSAPVGDCVLTGNYCLQSGTGPTVAIPIVDINAISAVVCNNRITGQGREFGLGVTATPTSPPTPGTAKVALIGNVVAAQITLNGALATASAWGALNVLV